MNATVRPPTRPLLVGALVGFVIGLLIGWLLIGWQLWPVEYVGEAYTYELNAAEKQSYVAAVVDSYNLTGQLETARQRLSAWTTEEKVDALARLFAEYQAEGRFQEAERVTDLARELQLVEGWDPQVVAEQTTQVAEEYAGQGAPDRAQAVALFAGELGTVPLSTSPATPATTGAASPAQDRTRLLLTVCGLLLLLLVLIVAALLLVRRRPRRRREAVEAPEGAEMVGGGPRPLLRKTSTYTLGMDNFDESFPIETDADEWLGECGMGISEALGDGAPRRVTAFEVWLFDKLNTRTVTKVLMSDFAHSNDTLRNKLAGRGDPVLATPGGTFTLETPALTVQVEIVEMEYGEGAPAFSYFETLRVQLTAYRNLQTEEGIDTTGS